jgi:hypothetical protein
MAELLKAVVPESPDAAAAARMLGRIRARLDEPLPIRSVRRDAGWTPIAPNIERKILFDDGVMVSWLMRLAPGADLPPHVHEDGPEECLVLEGEVCFGGERYGPGDYMIAPKGSCHSSTRSQTGAVMFLRTPSQ